MALPAPEVEEDQVSEKVPEEEGESPPEEAEEVAEGEIPPEEAEEVPEEEGDPLAEAEGVVVAPARPWLPQSVVFPL